MRQLLFASAPSGLAPGRSGYCTVARSADLGERLVRELETLGAHEPGEGACHAFRVVRSAGETCAVLTRYADAGPDYTGRDSTLAHHLVFSLSEIGELPPPADIARRFAGWFDRWEGPPRFIGDATLALAGKPASLPASEWKRATGDAGKAALFCDDSGRAKPGVMPAPAGADALALIAEASLLLEDKGWTTPFTTRRDAPDKECLWRTSPLADPRTLPDPGLARRATLARAGVMPGARPAPNANRAVPRSFGAEPAPTATQTAPASSRNIALVALTATAALATASVFVMLHNGETETGDAASSSTVTEAPAPATPLKTPHPLTTEALAAIKAGDLTAAAAAWLALGDAAPAEALERRADILPEIRAGLVSDGLFKITSDMEAVSASPEASGRKRIRDSITKLRDLCSRTGTPVPAGEAARLASLERELDAMERAEAALPACRIVIPRWTPLGDTGLATSECADLGEAPEPAEFLGAKRARVSLSVAPFTGFSAPARAAFSTTIPPKDFSPGKALVVEHPEHHRLLGLEIDSRKRITLTRRRPKAADPASLPLPVGRASLVTLSDDDTGERASLLLSESGVAPTPLILSADLLREGPGGVSPPAWLNTLVMRLRAQGAQAALLPHGFNGVPRDHPGLEAGRAVVEQALRARLAEARRSAAGAGDIPALERALANLPGNLREAGAPWTICLAPPGAGVTLTLVRFDKP